MPEDVLAPLPIARVAAWYRRLATAASAPVPALADPPLSGPFLLAYLDNRTHGATVRFTAPRHLREAPEIRRIQREHRDIFLSQRRAKLPGKRTGIVGILPRLRGDAAFTKWDGASPLAMSYESLCDFAPTPMDIARIQLIGTAAELDLLTSLRGFQLRSEVSVVGFRDADGTRMLRFASWQLSGNDLYDFNYDEHLTLPNPDYRQSGAELVRPDLEKITVFHSNAKRLEDAGLAAPFRVAIRPWRPTDPALMLPAPLPVLTPALRR
ncbi:MAG: hypothetical protein MUF21_12370 [Gemmatimonadaceae bacterium]|jgi:hypothetical protein|nr:hypothetical protein [Gemmatimonadaceae bacterium]